VPIPTSKNFDNFGPDLASSDISKLIKKLLDNSFKKYMLQIGEPDTSVKSTIISDAIRTELLKMISQKALVSLDIPKKIQ